VISGHKQHLTTQAGVLATSPKGYDGTGAFLQSSTQRTAPPVAKKAAALE